LSNAGIVAAIWLLATGVGHFATNYAGVGVARRNASDRTVIDAVGVPTQHPDSVSFVGRSGMVRSHNSPPRIKPQRGKVTEDHGKSSGNKHRAVFHPHESRSYLTDDARHLAPETGSLAGDAGALSGDADVLAGESARYHVNTASPWASVKGADVIPDRERREAPVVLSGHENASGVAVVLDGADAAPSEEVAAENASTSTRE
jgi:hypothetical protein